MDALPVNLEDTSQSLGSFKNIITLKTVSFLNVAHPSTIEIIYVIRLYQRYITLTVTLTFTLTFTTIHPLRTNAYIDNVPI